MIVTTDGEVEAEKEPRFLSGNPSGDAPAMRMGARGTPCDGELGSVVNVGKATRTVVEFAENERRQRNPNSSISVVLGFLRCDGLGFRDGGTYAILGVLFIGLGHDGFGNAENVIFSDSVVIRD